MSVLDRSALEASPLADLHATASELSVDGYRRLRRADLIDAILAKQSGTAADAGEAEQSEAGEPASRRRRGRRGGRGRTSAREENGSTAGPKDAEEKPSEEAESDQDES